MQRAADWRSAAFFLLLDSGAVASTHLSSPSRTSDQRVRTECVDLELGSLLVALLLVVFAYLTCVCWRCCSGGVIT